MTNKILFSVFCLVLAAQYNLYAQDNLALGKDYYKQGWNTPWVDSYFPQAVTHLEMATEEGFGEAAYLLGNIYSKGCGMEVDYLKAAEYYEKAVRLGYDYGEVELGSIVLHRIDDEKLHEQAFEMFRSAALKGQKKGYWYMALCYWYKGKEDLAYELIREDFYQIYLTSEDPYLLNMIASYCQKPEYTTPRDLDGSFDLGTHASKKWDGEFGLSLDRKAACEVLWDTGWGGNIYDAALIMYHNDIKEIRTYRQYDVNAKWPFNRNEYHYENPIKRQFFQVMADALKYSLDDEQKAYGYYIYAKYLEDNNISDSCPASWGISLTKVGALTLSAEMGCADAQKLLADWYEQGHNVSKNLIRAQEWREKIQ